MTRNRWKRKSRLSHEQARKMGIASQRAQAERRMADLPERLLELAEIEAQNLPRKAGDAIGCLQWTCFRSGRVRRWIIRIGSRADRLTLESPGGKPTSSHGWSWILTHLRRHLVARS